MMRIVLSALMMVGLASALIEQPVPCIKYDIVGTNLGSTPGLETNLLYYNGIEIPGNTASTGVPRGPYFTINDGDCYWFTNSLFHCSLKLYADSSHSLLIGSASLDNTGFNYFNDTTIPFEFAFGNLLLTQTMLPGFVPPLLQGYNFQNRTNVPLSFRKQQEYPATPLPPVANGITHLPGDLHYLTLWGSNGYDGTTNTFDNTRTTGIDFRGRLICSETPIIPECPCPNALTVPIACLQYIETVITASDTGCAKIVFADLPDPGAVLCRQYLSR